MNTIQKVIMGVLVVAALVFGVLYFNAQSKVSNLEDQLGAAGIGPNHYQKENFLGGFTAGANNQLEVGSGGKLIQGGSEITITGNKTLTSSELCGLSLMRWKGPNFNQPTVNLPAATSTPCLPNTGDSLKFFVHNTATSGITFLGSIGGGTIFLQSTTTANGFLNPSKSAIMTGIRASTTAIFWFMESFE